jgi:hypothetical protein
MHILFETFPARSEFPSEMSKAEFERHARKFQRMAAETKDEHIRNQLIEIAGEWMRMAKEQQQAGDKSDQ